MHYLTLLPSTKLVAEASSIFISNEAVAGLNWAKLKQVIHPRVYDELVRATLGGFALRSGNYLFAAEKLNELLGDKRTGLDYLAEMLAKQSLQRTIY